VRRMADDLWKSALALAGEQAQQALASQRTAIEQEREALAAARAVLQEERSQFAQKEIHWEHQLQEGRERCEVAAARARDLEAELAATKQELSQARTRLDEVAIAREADLQGFKQQLGSLAAERERIQERAAASERRHLEEVDRARQETKQLRRQHAETVRKLQEQSEALQNECRSLQDQVAAAATELAASQQRLTASERLLGEYQTLLKAQSSQTPAEGKRARRRVVAAPADKGPGRRSRAV